jgi:geranylgeranyl transferase type-2 subunit alpha
MLNLAEYTARSTITPNFATEDRVTYILREIEEIRDLLQDYEDIKWIYEALMEYTLALSVVEERVPSADEKRDLKTWLGQLRKLDPMRNGRWHDVEREYGLR